MGASFTNLTVCGPDQGDVVECLNEFGYSAFVAPTVNGWTLIAEKESESFDFDIVRGVAERLSAKLACAALSVQFYDDDVLLLQVYAAGTFVESYSSNPAYGAEDISEMFEVDRGGDAEQIALAFNKPEAVQSLQQALHGDMEELDIEFTQLSERMSEALQSGDIDTVKAVQLRLMEKTRELSEAGDDPFLRFAPGFDARRRYAKLVKSLNLPIFSQDFGYRYLENGEILEGLDPTQLRKIDQKA